MVRLRAHSLGTTGPQMMLENQAYTNIVMVHPDDTLLCHEDNCCGIIKEMCWKWAVLPWWSPRDWLNYGSSEIPNLRQCGCGMPRAFPCQLVGCGRVNVSPRWEDRHLGCLSSGWVGMEAWIVRDWVTVRGWVTGWIKSRPLYLNPWIHGVKKIHVFVGLSWGVACATKLRQRHMHRCPAHQWHPPSGPPVSFKPCLHSRFPPPYDKRKTHPSIETESAAPHAKIKPVPSIEHHNSPSEASTEPCLHWAPSSHWRFSHQCLYLIWIPWDFTHNST